MSIGRQGRQRRRFDDVGTVGAVLAQEVQVSLGPTSSICVGGGILHGSATGRGDRHSERPQADAALTHLTLEHGVFLSRRFAVRKHGPG
jgi:hypothetical protein